MCHLKRLHTLEIHANRLRSLPPSLSVLQPFSTSHGHIGGSLTRLTVQHNPLDPALLAASDADEILSILRTRSEHLPHNIAPGDPSSFPSSLASMGAGAVDEGWARTVLQAAEIGGYGGGGGAGGQRGGVPGNVSAAIDEANTLDNAREVLRQTLQGLRVEVRVPLTT
jgi:hypothetical protein